MLETSARLLQLLSLLQSRAEVNGTEAAEKLGVTTRTIRRDVDRLRELGYPVDSDPGVNGGYRLGVGAVRHTTVRLAGTSDDVDPQTLIAVAQAAAATERIRVVYRDAGGRETERRLDPHKLVSTGRRWYLVAFDVDRADWRTLRVDRIVELHRTGHRVRLDHPPDAAELVSRAVSVAPYRYTAKVVIDMPADELRRRVPATVGVVEPKSSRRSVLTTGSDDLDALAGHLVALGRPFKVLRPKALRDRVHELADVLRRA